MLDGVLVRGRIDAIYRRDDGGYDVIDYKTGARPARRCCAKRRRFSWRVTGWRGPTSPRWIRLGSRPVSSMSGTARTASSGRRCPSRDELARLLVEPGAPAMLANLAS